jgi:hypothetical protein
MVDAQKNYKKALEKGVLKILSKVCRSSCAALCVQLWRSDMRNDMCLRHLSTWHIWSNWVGTGHRSQHHIVT